MTMVTRQNLLAQKTRFLISVGGIALAVFLMSFLLSLYQGWRLNVGRFVEHVDADVWVARQGSTDFLNAASLLPIAMQEELAAVPGVSGTDPIIVRPLDIEANGELETTHLVGYETNGGAGGPVHVSKGKNVPGPGEIVIDEAFQKKTGVDIGDDVDISGQPVRVVGISTGGNLVFSQTSFLSIETARSVLGMSGYSTFYLLHLAPGADAEAVIQTVDEREPSVGAYTKAQFASATRDRIMRNLLPILAIILALAFVVGVAITGLTIYTATIEKSREYGILKAIGFTNGYLFRRVLEQSLVTGVFGFAVGACLTVVASQFVADVVPQFVTLLLWRDFGLVLAATVLMSAIAALLPVRLLTSVDPVSVFSG